MAVARFAEVLGIPPGDRIPLSKITRALDLKGASIRKMAQAAKKGKKK